MAAGLEAVQLLAGLCVAGWLLAGALPRAGDPATALLLAYWAVSLPLLGPAIALAARQYPALPSITSRLLEPLGALEGEQPATRAAEPGAAIRLEGVGVQAAGHTLLDGVDLDIPPGSHVAIIGPSGAGKSSLLAFCSAGTGRPGAACSSTGHR